MKKSFLLSITMAIMVCFLFSCKGEAKAPLLSDIREKTSFVQPIQNCEFELKQSEIQTVSIPFDSDSINSDYVFIGDQKQLNELNIYKNVYAVRDSEKYEPLKLKISDKQNADFILKDNYHIRSIGEGNPSKNNTLPVQNYQNN